jgi:U3 small nucleolar RNA-associated protein 14
MRGREGDEWRERMLEKLGRIKGAGSDEESGNECGEEDDDDSNGNMEGTVDKLQQAVFRTSTSGTLVARLNLRGPGKSIFDMKFMKEAMLRQQHIDGMEDNEFAQDIDTTIG